MRRDVVRTVIVVLVITGRGREVVEKIFDVASRRGGRDVERFFDKLVPEHGDYEHDDEGADDMPSHIRMVLTRTSETVPIVDGKMQLGTWQGIFLFEHRRAPHRRRICLTTIGE